MKLKTYFPSAKHSSFTVEPLAAGSVSGNWTSILGSYSPITPVEDNWKRYFLVLKAFFLTLVLHHIKNQVYFSHTPFTERITGTCKRTHCQASQRKRSMQHKILYLLIKQSLFWECMKSYTVRDKNIHRWQLDVLLGHSAEGKSYHQCAALEELVTQELGCWSQCWLQHKCNFPHLMARLWLCRGDRSLETQIADCPLVQMMDIHWRSKQMTVLVGNKKRSKYVW